MLSSWAVLGFVLCTSKVSKITCTWFLSNHGSASLPEQRSSIV